MRPCSYGYKCHQHRSHTSSCYYLLSNILLDCDVANLVISVVPLVVVVIGFYVLVILAQHMVIVAMIDVMEVFAVVIMVKTLDILAVDRVG